MVMATQEKGLNFVHHKDDNLAVFCLNCLSFSSGFIHFKGFGDRLLSEVKKLAPKDIKIRVSNIHVDTRAAKREVAGVGR